MIMPINSQSRETRETRDFQGFACKNTQLFRDQLEHIPAFNNHVHILEEIKLIIL
jgi:hypothetical protein